MHTELTDSNQNTTPFPTEITLTGAPTEEDFRFLQHTVSTNEVNELTVELDAALVSTKDADKVFENMAARLVDNDGGRFAAMLTRSISHLVFRAEEELERGLPTVDRLEYLHELGSFAFQAIIDSACYDQMNPEARVSVANSYARLGTQILELSLNSALAIEGVEAATAFLTTVRTLVVSNELSDFAVPLSELYSTSECAEVLLSALFVTEQYSEEFDGEELDELLELAFDIAAATRNPALSGILQTAYEAYREHMDDMLDPEREDDEIEGALLDPDSRASRPPLPTFDEFQELREMSLRCLHAFALCGSGAEAIEIFQGILDADANAPESAEALLGLCHADPEGARPYLHTAIREASEGNPSAI